MVFRWLDPRANGPTQAKQQMKAKNCYKYKCIHSSEDARLYPAMQCMSDDYVNVSETDCYKSPTSLLALKWRISLFICLALASWNVLNLLNELLWTVYLFNGRAEAKGAVYLKMLRCAVFKQHWQVECILKGSLIGTRLLPFTSHRIEWAREMEFTESWDTNFSFWHLMQVPWLPQGQWITT